MHDWPPRFDWLKAEERWKSSLGEDLRSAILQITVETLGDAYGEADAKTRQNAADQLRDLARQVRKVRSALNSKTPVATYVRTLLQKSLASDIVKNGDGQATAVEELQHSLESFEQACMLAQIEALDPLGRLSPSEAWDKWTTLLFDRMFLNTPLKYGDGSRYTGVVYELQKALPQELSRHGQSIVALDKALRMKLGKRLSSRRAPGSTR